jgi:hypothetical protein
LLNGSRRLRRGATALALRATTCRGGLLPAATLLSASILGAQLTTSVGGEQLAWVEPMLRDGSGEDRAKLAAKLRDLGAAVVPEGVAVRNVRER